MNRSQGIEKQQNGSTMINGTVRETLYDESECYERILATTTVKGRGPGDEMDNQGIREERISYKESHKMQIVVTSVGSRMRWGENSEIVWSYIIARCGYVVEVLTDGPPLGK